ncbi:MAG: Crp/Fnr family transcriptional regulator, partial [Shinella sp.]|uniref:Crp/Fnr family transcriptional regulator n=1 Tax=Shinella sp. TaxID=1870904 RepID=UPI0040355051
AHKLSVVRQAKLLGFSRTDFPISRQDIAEMTGTTLHTVSRILSAWESHGLVEGGRQKLLICDTAGLSALADGVRD